MKRSLSRDPSPARDAEGDPPPPQHPDGEEAQAWPSRRFKTWPIAADWSPPALEARVGPIAYQQLVGAVQHLFTDEAMTDVLERLRDYCFQQNGESNANARDRAFFIDALTHDMIFFEGDQQRRIIEDFPLDPDIYAGLPQLEGSLLDVYRIESRGILGGLRARSLLRDDVEVRGGGRVLRAPRKGSLVLGRFVRIGRGLMLDAPFLLLTPTLAETLREIFDHELAGTRVLHPELSREGLLKVAGYHLYEEAAARLLDAAALSLPDDHTFAPRLVEWVGQHPRDLPDLRSVLEDARVIEADESGRPTMVTVALSKHSLIHRTLREAMISIEGKTMTLIAFIDRGADALCERLSAALSAKIEERRPPLSPAAVYRSLRHVVR